MDFCFHKCEVLNVLWIFLTFSLNLLSLWKSTLVWGFKYCFNSIENHDDVLKYFLEKERTSNFDKLQGTFSWQNSFNLCPASFCIPRSNLPVSPGVSWLPTFAFHSPIIKGHLFWVLVLKGLVGLHKTIQLQLLQHYWLGHRLGLLWYWMVCLRYEQRSFCRFWDCIQVLHFGLFCWPWWQLHFFWGIPARSSRYNGHLR